MTLEEAIKILEQWYRGGYATKIGDITPAIKLGIEALKRIQINRRFPIHINEQSLPGEEYNSAR